MSESDHYLKMQSSGAKYAISLRVGLFKLAENHIAIDFKDFELVITNERY